MIDRLLLLTFQPEVPKLFTHSVMLKLCIPNTLNSKIADDYYILQNTVDPLHVALSMPHWLTGSIDHHDFSSITS